MNNKKRPDYFSSRYCSPVRMLSYGYQIKEACATAPENLLEIGIGNGLVAKVLKDSGIRVTTMDIDATLEPDVEGSVLDMPFADNSFDTILCCEVLEHLRFEDMPKALSEISRTARGSVVLSLPDSTRHYEIKATLPRIEVNWAIDVGYRPSVHQFDGEHFWEIGKKGFPLKRICREINQAGLRIGKTYRLPEYPYHRMFTCEKPRCE